jgi:alkylation response protein AidB-like acyl-CoA dehydrogenase
LERPVAACYALSPFAKVDVAGSTPAPARGRGSGWVGVRAVDAPPTKPRQRDHLRQPLPHLVPTYAAVVLLHGRSRVPPDGRHHEVVDVRGTTKALEGPPHESRRESLLDLGHLRSEWLFSRNQWAEEPRPVTTTNTFFATTGQRTLSSLYAPNLESATGSLSQAQTTTSLISANTNAGSEHAFHAEEMTAMTTNSADVLSTVDRIAREVAAFHAGEVDSKALFPSASLQAMREAGLLGLLSAQEVGGLGGRLRIAAQSVERMARSCGSTAMVLCMHYCGASVIEKFGSEAVRREVAAGRHLSTLAFSETGSRSQFWTPVGTAMRVDGGIRLDARKSWVTSVRHATAYVWSSRPVSAAGASTLWLVPADTRGLTVPQPFDGLGLRGNESSPVTADKVVVPEQNRLGEDGAGFAAMMEIVLPVFNVLTAACSIGLMTAAVERTAAHATATRFEPAGSTVADLPTVRAFVARMHIQTETTRALWLDTITALEEARPDAMLRVLACKAAAGEAAPETLGLAMRVCGGAAFRREVGVERLFRDAQAGTIMAPTTDVLYDFIGKAVCGLPLF